MPRNKGYTPLSSGDREWLLDYIATNGLQKKQVAEQVGIPRSTFSEILDGKPAWKKNKDKVHAFIRTYKKDSGNEVKDVLESLAVPSGENSPSIPKERMSLLLSELKSGADMVINAMTEIVNAGFGDRKKLRELCGAELDKVRLLSRALSSEDQLNTVKRESGKTSLP